MLEIRLALDSVRERAVVETVPQNPRMSWQCLRKDSARWSLLLADAFTLTCLLCVFHWHLYASVFEAFSHRPPKAAIHQWGRSYGRLFWRTGMFSKDISAPSVLI